MCSFHVVFLHSSMWLPTFEQEKENPWKINQNERDNLWNWIRNLIERKPQNLKFQRKAKPTVGGKKSLICRFELQGALPSSMREWGHSKAYEEEEKIKSVSELNKCIFRSQHKKLYSNEFDSGVD